MEPDVTEETDSMRLVLLTIIKRRAAKIARRLEWLEQMLFWMWGHAAVAWDEWHMARLDHTAPVAEWHRRIHRAARWRNARDGGMR